MRKQPVYFDYQNVHYSFELQKDDFKQSLGYFPYFDSASGASHLMSPHWVSRFILPA